MYSGTTIGKGSGRVLGAHQKIDRVARRALEGRWPDVRFPPAKEILHFEGANGPDAIKRKSPAKDEPWHYFDPIDPTDVALPNIITLHHGNLVNALAQSNQERAAFEAAWLAHAIVDGLTPAHHYPLEEKLTKLRGEAIATRTTIKDKLFIRAEGDTRRQVLAKNWHMWGAKGVMTTHGLFEWGVATTIAPLRLKSGYPTANDYIRVSTEGIIPLFHEAARQIYDLHMYEKFYKRGWTRKLAEQTSTELVPRIVKLVTLAWFNAAWLAYTGGS
jgi:hypothetical protein